MRRGHSSVAAARWPRPAWRSSTSELGDPPITSEDGGLGAVLNGEIYNFRELRERADDEPATGLRRAATRR